MASQLLCADECVEDIAAVMNNYQGFLVSNPTNVYQIGTQYQAQWQQFQNSFSYSDQVVIASVSCLFGIKIVVISESVLQGKMNFIPTCTVKIHQMQLQWSKYFPYIISTHSQPLPLTLGFSCNHYRLAVNIACICDYSQRVPKRPTKSELPLPIFKIKKSSLYLQKKQNSWNKITITITITITDTSANTTTKKIARPVKITTAATRAKSTFLPKLSVKATLQDLRFLCRSVGVRPGNKRKAQLIELIISTGEYSVPQKETQTKKQLLKQIKERGLPNGRKAKANQLQSIITDDEANPEWSPANFQSFTKKNLSKFNLAKARQHFEFSNFWILALEAPCIALASCGILIYGCMSQIKPT